MAYYFRTQPFNALFEELVNRAFERPEQEARELETSSWTPAVDAFVDGESVVLEVMLAGVDPKNVELSATGNRLTIKGTRERRASKDAKSLGKSEIVYGAFERTLELPEGTDASKAEARFEHGVLEVRLPAAGAFVPRKIEIKPA